MCPVPAESRLIGYSKESTWTPKIPINYVDTKNQLADILTKGNFTRNEWNHLLRLFNIMDISQFASSHFSSTSSSQTMSKRLIQQERPGEDERVVAKSKPMLHLVSKTVDRYPTTPSSIASYSPGTLKAKFKFGTHQYGETCIQRFEWKHSIESSSEAIWCKSELQCRETCGRNDK